MLNKQGKFDIKIFLRYVNIVIFVLGYFPRITRWITLL